MPKKTYKPQLYDQVLESIGMYAFSQPDEYMAYICDVGNRVLRMRAKMATKERKKERSKKLRSYASALDLLARSIRKER